MPQWWHGKVGYEVYVRSFADSDGDGIGDLPGIRSRLPYLADLGVDIVWITPFYPSPQADHGYDVADYLDVEPAYGTLDDLDGLVGDAHDLGLRVVIDLVPNHSSDRHPWFVDALSGRDAEHRDYYVWRDPAPDGGPPNNWVSHFGGPAWTYDEPSGQYYMHLFLPEQPDLNWTEPRVHEEFRRILDTWFTRGIDGVRIDVAHSLIEDPEFRDNPKLPDAPDDPSTPDEVFASFDHRHDLDQDGVLDIYRDWRTVADPHDAALLGEVYVLRPERLARYLRDDGLHAGFCFESLKVDWDADEIRDTLRVNVEASGHGLAWPLSSHDDPRAATRFGGGDLGAQRALAYLTFLCGLPGVPFLFQGDELGLDDGVFDGEVAEDPISARNPGAAGRDPVRTPMLWEPGPGFGFTTGTPWLPFGANRNDRQTVAAQIGDPWSHLERTRELLAARRSLVALTQPTDTSWPIDEGAVIAVERGDEVLVVLHVGDEGGPAELELPEGSHLVYASGSDVVMMESSLLLPEDRGAIVALPGARFVAADDDVEVDHDQVEAVAADSSLLWESPDGDPQAARGAPNGDPA
jgi:alpha-glucosidase